MYRYKEDYEPTLFPAVKVIAENRITKEIDYLGIVLHSGGLPSQEDIDKCIFLIDKKVELIPGWIDTSEFAEVPRATALKNKCLYKVKLVYTSIDENLLMT